MYNLVPADSEAHKQPPKKPFNVPDGIMPDQMVNQPRSKTSFNLLMLQRRILGVISVVKHTKIKTVWVLINVGIILSYH